MTQQQGFSLDFPLLYFTTSNETSINFLKAKEIIPTILCLFYWFFYRLLLCIEGRDCVCVLLVGVYMETNDKSVCNNNGKK